MRKIESEEGRLMLTPLLDMFTIILIFLIVSFEVEDMGFQPSEKVDLPTSRARSILKPAVNVAITPDELLVENETTVPLKGGEFDDKYYESERIPPLVQKLEAYNEKITGEGGTDATDAGAVEAILMVQADKGLEYRTLYLVLRSGALAGFTEYRLATRKN